MGCKKLNKRLKRPKAEIKVQGLPIFVKNVLWIKVRVKSLHLILLCPDLLDQKEMENEKSSSFAFMFKGFEYGAILWHLFAIKCEEGRQFKLLLTFWPIYESIFWHCLWGKVLEEAWILGCER